MATKAIPVSAFSKLNVTSGFDVDITVGDRDEVTVRVDDKLIDKLDVGVSGDTLHIGLVRVWWSVRRAMLHADVTVRNLSAVKASGGAALRVAGTLNGDRLDLGLSGASTFEGAVDLAASADLVLSGASRATLSGKAAHLDLGSSGASTLQAAGLELRDAEIQLSGASHATVTVHDSISADLSGASILEYEGEPTLVRRNTSGASSIVRG